MSVGCERGGGHQVLFSLVFSFFLSQFKNYSHDSGKAVRRVPKRKQRARDTETQRRSVLNVRIFLREFCVDFLEHCYNRLMYLVKVAIISIQITLYSFWF